jgi:hypothetical protein
MELSAGKGVCKHITALLMFGVFLCLKTDDETRP